MNAATKKPFWLVWNPQGHAPTHRHDTRESAEREAERLARMHSGRRFIVLQSVCERIVDDMQRINHEADGQEIPF